MTLMPKSKTEWALVVVGVFLLLGGLFYGLSDWSGSNAWTKYRREWEAKSEKFDFKDFIPPPVPDDKNFALTPIVSSSYEQCFDTNGNVFNPPHTNVVNRLGMEVPGGDYQIGYKTNTGNWAVGRMADLKAVQNYFRTLNETSNAFSAVPPQSPAADVLLAIRKYDSDIEEVRAAAQLPCSRFPLDYGAERPYDILLPHLAALKLCSGILQLRALAELESGQSEKALEDIKLILRLQDSICTEPFLISSLVRIGMIQMALQPIWEGLAKHRWSDTQLIELEHELARLDLLSDYGFAMRGERASSIASIEHLRRTRNPLWFEPQSDDAEAVDRTGESFGKIVFHLVPNSIFYRNEMVIAQMHQQWFLQSIDQTNHLAFPKVVRQGEAAVDKLGEHFSPNNLFARMLLPAVGSANKRFTYTQSFNDMARIACALERYRLAKGNFPESLDVLAPQFMKKIPHDIIGGQPLKYRRTDDGHFILYSIGWNETDDNGTIAFRKSSERSVDISQGDWVWKN